MSSASVQDQGLLSKLLPSARDPLTATSSSASSAGDPAQAALILLLAGKNEKSIPAVLFRRKKNFRKGRVSTSTSHQSVTSFLQGILKKLESGENASQILR